MQSNGRTIYKQHFDCRFHLKIPDGGRAVRVCCLGSSHFFFGERWWTILGDPWLANCADGDSDSALIDTDLWCLSRSKWLFSFFNMSAKLAVRSAVTYRKTAHHPWTERKFYKKCCWRQCHIRNSNVLAVITWFKFINSCCWRRLHLRGSQWWPSSLLGGQYRRSIGHWKHRTSRHRSWPNGCSTTSCRSGR